MLVWLRMPGSRSRRIPFPIFPAPALAISGEYLRSVTADSPSLGRWLPACFVLFAGRRGKLKSRSPIPGCAFAMNAGVSCLPAHIHPFICIHVMVHMWHVKPIKYTTTAEWLVMWRKEKAFWQRKDVQLIWCIVLVMSIFASRVAKLCQLGCIALFCGNIKHSQSQFHDCLRLPEIEYIGQQGDWDAHY